MKEIITSHANQRIKQIRKLRDRKERQSSGLFLLEGLRIVGDAFDQSARIECLVFAPELLKSEYGESLVQKADMEGIPVLEVSAEIFRSLSSKEGPQGIAAVAHQEWLGLADLHLTSEDLWVALDSIADPGNLGTIMRTLDAVNGRGVILLDHCTDPYDSSSMRASMGSIFTMKIVKASFEEFAAWKTCEEVRVVGTSDQADCDYEAADYSLPMVLLMGSERMGLQQHHFDLCDEVVSIPMRGAMDSLNLAVATGVMLYQIYTQQRRK
jgi:TrmH family RNA methyltransferase